ncbi:hypothetical protein H5410_053327 [Solanum commersonii]|uniref:Uncharacterized protein n=1 Tax=Solanum commersonii TaxID=4109 RepID=A0A9J5X5Z5_SOLCO|nr:hypothetical protein H5410_053327 [Solanum commersonii]
MEGYEAAGIRYESIAQSIDLAYNNLLIGIIMYQALSCGEEHDNFVWPIEVSLIGRFCLPKSRCIVKTSERKELEERTREANVKTSHSEVLASVMEDDNLTILERNRVKIEKDEWNVITEEALPFSGQRVGTKTSRRRSFHHTKLQQTATDGNLKAKTPELLSSGFLVAGGEEEQYGVILVMLYVVFAVVIWNCMLGAYYKRSVYWI